MGAVGLSFLVLLAALLAWPLYVNIKVQKPFSPLPERLRDEACRVVAPTLENCESLVAHGGSGLVFAACTTNDEREAWWPMAGVQTNRTVARSAEPYLAFYNPKTKQVTRIAISGPQKTRLASPMGMDVVDDPAEPGSVLLFVLGYPRDDAAVSPGALYVYRHKTGSAEATLVRVVRDAGLLAPNGVAALSATRVVIANTRRYLNALGSVEVMAALPTGSIGLLDLESGRSVWHQGFVFPNGIAVDAARRYVFLANSAQGLVDVFDLGKHSGAHATWPSDAPLARVDQLDLGYSVDNLHRDPVSGAIYAAGSPQVFRAMATIMSEGPTARPLVVNKVMRISNATGDAVFYGHRFSAETVLITAGPDAGAPYKFGPASSAVPLSTGGVLLSTVIGQGLLAC